MTARRDGPRRPDAARAEVGLGLRVARSGLLASFDSQGLVKRGDTYFSENWESAANGGCRSSINAAFGTVRVVWVDS
jgi:hypothetical protein